MCHPLTKRNRIGGWGLVGSAGTGLSCGRYQFPFLIDACFVLEADLQIAFRRHR